MSTYKIIKGDTLWDISIKYGIGLNELIAANPQIENPDLIFPNQIINIPDGIDVPSSTDDIRALEAEVIRLVNIERKKAGRPALTENSKLSDVARTKSKDFVNNNYFAHNSPTYGTPFNMLKTFGISFNSAAENLASGQETATEAMNSWMNSSGHKANILSSAYNQIGVGVAKDNKGNLYWTQIFIRS